MSSETLVVLAVFLLVALLIGVAMRIGETATTRPVSRYRAVVPFPSELAFVVAVLAGAAWLHDAHVAMSDETRHAAHVYAVCWFTVAVLIVPAWVVTSWLMRRRGGHRDKLGGLFIHFIFAFAAGAYGFVSGNARDVIAMFLIVAVMLIGTFVNRPPRGDDALTRRRQ